MHDVQHVFQEQGYVIIRQQFPKEQAAFAEQFYGWLAPHLPMGDRLCKKSLWSYRNEFTDALLVMMLPEIEQYTGLKLYPTYSYSRIYLPGEVLERHTDREACEVSATVPLQIDPEYPWTFCLESLEGMTHQVDLVVGDYLIYKGRMLLLHHTLFSAKW